MRFVIALLAAAVAFGQPTQNKYTVRPNAARTTVGDFVWQTLDLTTSLSMRGPAHLSGGSVVLQWINNLTLPGSAALVTLATDGTLSTKPQSDFVTIGSAETISGAKTFSAAATFNNTVSVTGTNVLQVGAGGIRLNGGVLECSNDRSTWSACVVSTSSFVSTTADQTISGTKTFSGTVNVTGTLQGGGSNGWTTTGYANCNSGKFSIATSKGLVTAIACL